MKKLIIIVLLVSFNFGNLLANSIIKPKSNNAVYLAAVVNVGYISNVSDIQVELARVGFQVVRQQQPLEVLKMSGPQNNEQLFAIQIYDDGKIIYYALRNPKQQGDIAKAMCEMFIQGKTGDDFFSALIGSAQFKPQMIKSLRDLYNWQWYAIDSGQWTFGRVYIQSGKKPRLYTNCYTKPDYVFFKYL